MFEGWFNFYSVFAVVVLVLFAVFMYSVYRMMEYQNAATPWPPATSSCPDGWTLDSAGWCLIPKAGTKCTTTPSATGGAWQTTGSQPSAWAPNQLVCSVNVGTLHATGSTYKELIAIVPAVHKSDSTASGGFTGLDITPADFRAGLVSIDFRTAAMELRRKFCEEYGIFWDGITSGGGSNAADSKK